MSKCKNCRIEILDETERCPLCNSVLEQTIEVENMYPDVRMVVRRMTLIGRIYLFCAILSEAILIAVNILTGSQTWWCAITGLSLFYVYMLIRFAILGKSGYKSKILILSLIALLMLIASDIVTGYRGWSVNYVLPSGIVLIDVGIIVLMAANRRNWQSYMMWQILMILCSLVPMTLYLAGIEKAPYFAFFPLAFSVFLFLGTVIIGDRRARLELKRRFHIR